MKEDKLINLLLLVGLEDLKKEKNKKISEPIVSTWNTEVPSRKGSNPSPGPQTE